jgi:hypothetical protein
MPYRGQRRQYNPYGGSGGRLSDLMLAQGEQQANLAREQGDIWGQFLQNVGQTAGDTLQAYQQDERERPAREQLERRSELEMEALEGGAAAAQKAAREAMILENQAANLVFREYKDGTYGVENFPAQLEGLRAAGLGHLAKDMIENYGSMHEATVTYKKSLKTALGQVMKNVSDDDFEGMSMALAYAVRNEMLTKEDAENILRDTRENPERIAVIRNGFINEAGLDVYGDPVTLAPGAILTRPGPGGTFEEVARGKPPPADMVNVPEGGRLFAIDSETGQRLLDERGVPIVYEGRERDDRPTPTARLNATISMRTRYQKELSVPAFYMNQLGLMRQAYQTALETGERLASDQAIITIFNKFLDPDSVVRESEFNRSADSQGIWDQMLGLKTRIMQGGSGLTMSNLKQFLDFAEAFAGDKVAAMDGITEAYVGIANKSFIDPSDIIGRRGLEDWSSRLGANGSPDDEVDLTGGVQ